ncbi:MAG: hypothetical protein ACKESC_01790, partial [Candidatus Hodgkinia cicadicola]
ELIALCGFEHPVLDLIKLCFGNASVLKITLVMLTDRCRTPNIKRLCYPNISPYSRIADLYDADQCQLRRLQSQVQAHTPSPTRPIVSSEQNQLDSINQTLTSWESCCLWTSDCTEAFEYLTTIRRRESRLFC